jgi:hypothetical protein
MQDEGWANLCSLTNKTYMLNQKMAGSQVCISLPPTYISFLFSCHIIHTASILILTSRDLHHTMTRSNTHLITYTTLYFPSGLPSAICSCSIMLTIRMEIHFQLTAMAPMGSSKAKGKARAKIPTLVINRYLSFDWDRIKGFISQHIHGLIWIYNVSGIKYEREWDLFCEIIFLDPVMTCHISQFQLI